MKGKIALASVLLSLAGCVTTGRYQALETENKQQKEAFAALDSQLKGSQKETASVRQELAASKAALETASVQWQAQLSDSQAKTKASAEELASAKTRISTLEDSNRDLRKSVETDKSEQVKKIAELTKEKDALAKKLADSAGEVTAVKLSRDTELAGLKGRLDTALAEKKALEAAKASELAALRSSKDGEIAAIKAQLDAAAAEKKALEDAKAAELARVKSSYESLEAGLKAEIADGQIKLSELKGKLTVNMVDRILFEPGEAAVGPEGKKVLGRIAKVIASVKDKDIRIEGHTDNKPIGGDLRAKFPTNWELSTARATAVARFLQEESKLDAGRLVATGYGEFRPVAPNDKPENRALNRRIEIVLVPRE